VPLLQRLQLQPPPPAVRPVLPVLLGRPHVDFRGRRLPGADLAGSLSLTAVYGLSCSLGVFSLGSAIGNLIDRSPRLLAARTSLVMQNGLVSVCAVIVCLILSGLVTAQAAAAFEAAKALVVATALLAQLASVASKICVSKDWIVAICGSDKELLATATAHLRRIDLSCQVLAPLLFGMVTTFVSPLASAITVACWNLVSIGRCWATSTPRCRGWLRKTSRLKRLSRTPTFLLRTPMMTLHPPPPAAAPAADSLGQIRDQVAGWQLYFRQPVFCAGLALSSLYLTVLGFDNVTTGYVYSQAVPAAVLSGCLAVSAVFGLLGTLLFPALRSRFGLLSSGQTGFVLQALSLLPCVLSVFAPGSPFDLTAAPPVQQINVTQPQFTELMLFTFDVGGAAGGNGTDGSGGDRPSSYASVALLLAGIVVSRTGLWLADLSITQLFLETVPERERGRVYGVQESLNQLLDLAKFGLVAALPLVTQFGLLVCLSYAAICCGGCLHLLQIFRSRSRSRTDSADSRSLTKRLLTACCPSSAASLPVNPPLQSPMYLDTIPTDGAV
uniref:Solute carrier family 40 member n=1 Tax=Macrostomum lignano TaxID=282301 RepID=A0A1I8FWZ8_9PLAT